MELALPDRVDTDLLDLSDRRLPRPQRVAVSPFGMVSTAHYRATEAGVAMLEQGGNAVDAAVAAAFALGVCEPAASGIGGQTMMLIHDASAARTVALDGSSRAPNRASTRQLSSTERLRGYCATTVPSTPAVLDYARARYGTLPLRDVLEPALKVAESGFQVTPLKNALARRELEHLHAGNASGFFLQPDGRPYPAGAILRQPTMAQTLRRLMEKGVEDFYLGEIAELIEADMIRNEGLIRKDDLAQIPRPIERMPLTARFEGHRVFTFPPPGAGRTLAEMLNIYHRLPPKRRDFDRPEGAAALAELIHRAFLDRSDRPFDPHFYHQLPEKSMLSDSHAKDIAGEITSRLDGFDPRGETTHLSVMDSAGSVVALTQSIERVFGAYVATPELGFLYNNYMSAFEYKDMSHPYYLRPNAVPWASVAPTIVFRGRKPWAVLGSPGSERIASAIFQTLIRLVQGATPFAAVDAPRLHSNLERRVSLEASRMRDDILPELERLGFTVDVRDPYSFYLGCVQLVIRDRGEFLGVADPRRDGSAGGPSREPGTENP